MNDFINEIYQNGEGKTVTGYYMNQPFIGQINMVRPTYGGDIKVYVALEQPIVFKDLGQSITRETLIFSVQELFDGATYGSVSKNLHVYL